MIGMNYRFTEKQKAFLISQGYRVRQFSNGQVAEKSVPVQETDFVRTSIYCLDSGISANASTPNRYMNPETLKKVCEASQSFIQDVEKLNSIQ